MRAVVATTGVTAGIKWPNDVLVGDRKVAGILAEREGDALVVGVGVNVHQDDFPPELAAGANPVATATIRMQADGRVLLFISSGELGQGSRTVFSRHARRASAVAARIRAVGRMERVGFMRLPRWSANPVWQGWDLAP